MDENEQVITEQLLNDENVPVYVIDDPIEQEQPSKADKFADFIGLYLGAIIFTLLGAVLLTVFFSIIPTINFSIVTILKTWAGLWGIMFARGALKNKVM